MNLFTETAQKARQVARALIQDESGATAIEYALVGVLISTGIAAGAVLFANSAEKVWNYASTTIVAALAS